MPEHANPAWGYRRRFTWEVATCPQEIAENAVDRAHFHTVHGTVDLPETTLTLEGPRREAVSQVRLKTPRGVVEGRIAVTAWGLGCSVTRFTGICDTTLIISHAPIDSQRVFSRFTFLQWGKGSRVGAAVIRDVVKQMEEDIPIWENKRYLERPLLCDGDGPIGRYRVWARRFYTAAKPG